MTHGIKWHKVLGIIWHSMSLADDEDVSSSFDEVRSHGVQVIDLHQPCHLSEYAIDETEVAAGHTDDCRDGWFVKGREIDPLGFQPFSPRIRVSSVAFRGRNSCTKPTLE